MIELKFYESKGIRRMQQAEDRTGDLKVRVKSAGSKLQYMIERKFYESKGIRCRVGQLLFRSFNLRSFALFKKSSKERLALLLFSKRAPKNQMPSLSSKKSIKGQIALSH